MKFYYCVQILLIVTEWIYPYSLVKIEQFKYGPDIIKGA